jgi:hypothetical protein
MQRQRNLHHDSDAGGLDLVSFNARPENYWVFATRMAEAAPVSKQCFARVCLLAINRRSRAGHSTVRILVVDQF